MTNRESFEEWYCNMFAGEGYDEALATFEREQRITEKLQEENRRLQDSRDNTVKMLKVVLGMLDRISHL